MRKLNSAAAALLLAGSGVVALSQTEFEVASIKPGIPDDRSGRFITMQGAHRFVVKNYTLKGLVGAAYNMTPRAISGGPTWIDSDRFDILAATGGERKPDIEQQMLMLRRLLAERFKLEIHRQQKEFSIYALGIAKDGPTLKERAVQPDGPTVLTNVLFPDHVRLPAQNVTMAQFASMMQRAVLDRPVVDLTGLPGRYDFTLEWTPDETQFGGQGPSATSESASPDLFTALQRQLGLKPEKTRGPVDAIVIDRVKRPSEN